MSDPTSQTTDLRERRPKLILQATALRDMEAGLPVSVELAAALRMELAAFFVADDASVEACRLPFATHLGFSGRVLAMQPARLQEIVRREARKCRQALVEAAARAGLPWSFEHVRGDASDLLATTSASDILVVGIDGLAASPQHRIANVRDYAPARGGILFRPGGRVRRSGPVVTIDRTNAGRGALADVAARLAAQLDAQVGHAELAAGSLGSDSVALLRASRLLLASLESPLLDNGAALGRIVVGFRVPLLVLRTSVSAEALDRADDEGELRKLTE